MIIYKITNKINGKVYIGQTRQKLERRWQQHVTEAKLNRKNIVFYRAIQKYGSDNWFIEILEEINDRSFLNEREQYWIAYYDTMRKGYNSNSGGKQGTFVSQETKNTIREKLKGRPSPLKGILRSEETKRKLY